VNRLARRANVAVLLVCLVALTAAPVGFAQVSKPQTPLSELDAFMEKVLKRREVNKQTLEQYVLDEVEVVEVLGPARMPVFRQKRDFTWYVRDGLHVRSPVKFDGVAVGDEARTKYEEGWITRERGRLANNAKREKERREAEAKKGNAPAPEPETEPSTDDPAGPSGASPIPTPRFVSEAYFMDFKFEAGNYYLVGKEQLEGKQVLRIEYYPKRMFEDDDDRNDERKDKPKAENTGKPKPERRARQRDRPMEQRIDQQMSKTALVTLWVDPTEHQIVKYTFDNVWMDFLPGGWFVKVDDIHASMTMGQPFPGVWLPRDMNVHAGITIALGSLEASYERRFSDYKQAETSSKIKIPKSSGGIEDPHDDAPADPIEPSSFANHDPRPAIGGPYLDDGSDDDPQTEVIGEIRVHGNAWLRDDEVVRLAGVALGQPLSPEGLKEIEQRLHASHRFETIEVRKRYRSLDMTDVALVLLVHERPGMTSETATEPQPPRIWSRLKTRLMFMPIVTFDDGYGFTYGGQTSTVNLLGAGERLSVPLTWGGTRRAALEAERTFKSGPLTRVHSSFGIWQRENPRFETDDQRVEWTARAERSFARIVRTGVETSRSTVDFGQLDDNLWTVGAFAALDTRGDPSFPRNAFLLGARWNALHVKSDDEPIQRYTTEARGYLGVFRQLVFAGRARYSTADRTLPLYERYLMGGSSTLRGFKTGTYDGDRMFVTSAELRLPITSVLSGAKLGVTAFMDAGKVFDVGQTLTEATWHRGVGGGVFLIATVFRLNVDVARGLKDGDTRLHVSSGFGF
jgi:hypothetical protein